MPDYRDDLRLAHVLADAADAATIEDRFKALDLKVETKPDMTPVSEADKAAEELIRGHLQRAQPRDAVLGEEYGIEGTGPRRWVIDPIDGTKNYVRGVPIWATLISLMEAGEGGYQPVVGRLRPRSAAAGGRRRGTARSPAGRPVLGHAPEGLPGSRMADASFAYSSLSGWEDQGRLDGFLDLTKAVWRTQVGDLALHDGGGGLGGHLRGARAVAVGHGGERDIVVTEAGSSSRASTATRARTGGNAAASNGVLHDELLGYLNQRY